MARDLSVKSKIVDSDQYVYRQERDLTKTQVDWDTVTKDLTETIETVRDDRENRKAEIQEATTKSINDLAEMEQYDSESLNVKVLQGSQWGSEFLASQNTLMKRGLLKPSDFMQSKQKVSDSFTQLKSALGKFDAEYKEGQERMNSQVPGEQSNVLEQGIKLGMSGVAGLSQWDFAGNPATGDMNFVKKGTDASNPANLMSLNSINQRLTQRSDYVSLSTSASEEVTRLGTQIEASFIKDGQRGAVESIESWLLMDNSKDMLKSLVGTVTATEAQRISILQDAGVTAKMMTQDPEEAAANPGDGTPGNPGYVLMVPNGDGQGTLEAELSPSQQGLVDKEAEKIIRSQLDEKLKIEQRLATTYEPKDSAAEINNENKNKELAGMYEEVVNFVTGNAAQAEQSATALASYANNNITDPDLKIKKITRPDGDGNFTVTRADGSTFDVSSKAADGTVLSTTDLVDSLYGDLIGESNVATARGAYGETGGVVGDTRGVGGAASNVRSKPIQPINYQGSIKVDGNDIGADAYLVSKLQESFDSGDNATGGEIQSAFTTVIDELIIGNDQLIDLGFRVKATDANDNGNDVIAFELPGLPDTGDGPGIRVISGTNAKTIAEAYSEMQAFINDWVKSTNESNKSPGAGDTAGQGGVPAGNVILEEEEE
jgi:hypothetical protein